MSVAASAPRLIEGRFEAGAPSAEGGGGVVYRARDTTTGATVALKILHDGAPGAAERFAQEATLLASLCQPPHPAIVRYVDHGVTSQGESWLAMEWLEGETLEDRLARGPLAIADVATLGARVLDGLASAHRKGVIHRDLKPANLFLVAGRVAEAKVLDFGVARRLFEARRTTMTGISAGTPLYMSPEQARGEPVDGRSDLFSLGAVLFECLTGQPAFLGDSEVAILAKICLDDSLDVRARCPSLPAAFADLLERMLAKNRDERPTDAREVASALEAIAERLRTETAVLRSGARRVLHTPTPPLTAGEHRAFSAVLVSAVAADDPAELLSRVRTTVTPFGASVDRLRDGSLVVVIAGRGAPTDQAVAAARAALQLRDQLRGSAFAVATGRADVRVRLSIGGVLEAAGRMLRGAPAGDVRVDPATARLIDSRFEMDHGAGAARVLFEKGLREAPRTVLGREVPCVGRDRELALLDGLYGECVSEPIARAAIVIGNAGVGKSRVRHALLERIANRGEPFELLAARGDAMRAGSPYALLGPAIRAAANVALTDAPEQQRARLAAHVGRRLAPEVGRRVVPFLGELAGVPFPDADSPALAAARSDPRLMADQVLEAWLAWLEAELAAGPVVLVLEDLQWGDVPSVQLVDAALRELRETPLLVAAFARPDVDETFPRVWCDRDLQRISLAPLGARAATKLLRLLLADAALSEERLAWIVERSEGNPFFLEELARAVAAGELTGDAVPDTVLGVVQARLDALGEQGKRVLRAASVYGINFPRAALTALLGEDGERAANEWLPVLVEREILFSGGRDDELAFRHALVRDAAYATLPPDDRRHGHRLAGQWLERANERDAVALVEHFERAELPLRAAGHCRTAAAQALEANDLMGAIERAERGVRNGATGELLGQLRLVEGQARYWRGEYPLAERCAEEAIALTTGATRVEATGDLMSALGVQGKFDALVTAFESLLASPSPDGAHAAVRLRALLRAGDFVVLARRHALVEALLALPELRSTVEREDASTTPDWLLVARHHHLNGQTLRHRGEASRSAVAFESSIRAYREIAAVREQQIALLNLGVTLLDLGQLERAESTLLDVLATGSRLAPMLIAATQVNLAQVWTQLGRYPEAIQAAHKAIEIGRSQGDRRVLGVGSCYLARACCASGRLDEADAAAQTALESLQDAVDWQPAAKATRAELLRVQGRTAEAMREARDAYEQLERLGTVEDGDALVRLVHAECLAAAGNVAEAAAVVHVAAQRLRSRASHIQPPDWSAGFLQRLGEHRRTLELEAAWSR